MTKESPRSPRSLSARTLSVLSDLTPKERSSVLSAFPEYEDEVQFVFRGKCKYQNQLQENGMVALSAHYVGVFGQRSSGYAFTKTGFFHILTMKTLEVSDNKSLLIETTSGRSLFVEGDTLELSRIIYRNYSFATILLPRTLKVKSSSRRDLPELKVPLSLSQKFQFTFAALCTQFEQRYDHSVVQYVHSLVTSSSSIVELNRIPAPYHAPLLMSLVNLPGIFGVSATDIDCPNVMRDVVAFVEKARNLRYLKVDNCNCVQGLAELGRAIQENAENLQLETLVIANNEFEDRLVFLESLSHLKSKLRTFSVSGIGLTESETGALLDHLLTDGAFKTLRCLGIGGISFTDDQLQRLATFLKRNKHLRTVDLSGSHDFAGVLKMLEGTTLSELSVTRCDFDDACVEQLGTLAPRLWFCDISGSNLKCREIGEILAVLGANRDEVAVRMNEFDFSGVNLFPILRGFLQSDLGKWVSVDMCDTQIKGMAFEALLALFSKMPRLTALSLDSNFGEDDVEYFSSLNMLQNLQYLSLASSKLSGLCPNLAQMRQLKYLNMADNGLTDEDATTLLSRDFEVLCLADNNIHNQSVLENMAHERSSMACDPLLKASMSFINDHKHLDEMAQMAGEHEILFGHSCICEDLGFALPCMCSVTVSPVAFGDADVYQLTHLNSVAVEVNREMGDLRKTVTLAPVMVSTRLGAPMRDVDDQMFTSDSSIDRLMNTNLIPTLSDTMFAGLGGEISETSSDNEHRTGDTLSQDPAVRELMNSRALSSGDLPALDPIDDDSSEEDQVEIVHTGAHHGRHQPAPQLEDSGSGEEEDDGFDWGETKKRAPGPPKPSGGVHGIMPPHKLLTESDIESDMETGSEEEQGYGPGRGKEFGHAEEEANDSGSRSENAHEEESELEPRNKESVNRSSTHGESDSQESGQRKSVSRVSGHKGIDSRAPSQRGSLSRNYGHRESDSQDSSHRKSVSRDYGHRESDSQDSSHRKSVSSVSDHRETDSRVSSHRESDSQDSSHRKSLSRVYGHRESDSSVSDHRGSDSGVSSHRKSVSRDYGRRESDSGVSSHRESDSQDSSHRKSVAQDYGHRESDSGVSSHRESDSQGSSHRRSVSSVSDHMESDSLEHRHRKGVFQSLSEEESVGPELASDHQSLGGHEIQYDPLSEEESEPAFAGEEEDAEHSESDQVPPHVRLFGPIGEESQSSSRSGSPKKPIPPPTSASSTTKFWKLSASLLPNLQSKPANSKHNPLLLAFSPPTLARKKT